MKRIVKILCVSLTLFIATTVGANAFSDTVDKGFIKDNVDLLKERVISDGYYNQAGYYTISDTELYDNAEEFGFIGVDDYGDLVFRYSYYVNDELSEVVKMDFDLPYTSYIQPEVHIFYESPYYMSADANFDASQYEWNDVVSFSQIEGSNFSKSFVNNECSKRLDDALTFWNGMLMDKADLCLANIGFTSLCNEHDTDIINVEVATCTNDGYTGDEMCFICGEVVNIGKVVPAGHKEVVDEGYAATCTATGLTEGKHCSICNTVLVKQETVPAKGHTEAVNSAVAPTCTTTGLTEGKYCAVCYTVLIKQEAVSALGHSENTAVETTATADAEGLVKTTCTTCGTVLAEKLVPMIGTVKLGTTKYVYNGNVRSPKVIVNDINGTPIDATNYTIKTPAGRTNTGKYTYTLTFKNEYSGTVTLTMQIAPKAPVAKAPAAVKKGLTAKWGKVAGNITGYEIQVATNKAFSKGKKTVTVKGAKIVSKKVTGLKTKTKYWVKVRAYKTVGSTKIYSSWSTVKTVKTK